MKTRFFAAALLVASCFVATSGAMAESNALTAGSAAAEPATSLNPLTGMSSYQAPINVDVKSPINDYRAAAGKFCNDLPQVQATPAKYHTCVDKVASAMMQAAETGDQIKVALDL